MNAFSTTPHGLSARQKRRESRLELDIWEDMIHDWPLFATFFPEGREAIEKIGTVYQGGYSLSPAAIDPRSIAVK